MLSCFRVVCLQDNCSDTDSLSPPAMTGFLEVPTSRGRGRLYFYPSYRVDSQDLPTGFFRDRRPRPSSLCIEAVLPDPPQSRPRFKLRKTFSFTTLARSRENAKRLLRLDFSQNNSTAPALQTVVLPPQPVADLVPPSSLDEMVGDRGRESGNTGVGGPISGMLHRPSLAEDVRRASIHSNHSDASTTGSSPIADEKPIASGNGVAISIMLAEPVLFLQGFDQNDTTSRNTTMLRGSMHLKITKQAKIKAISLNFKGKSETEWPEGIPPKRTDFKDWEIIMNHTWPFFNAQFPNAEHSYCADHVQLAKAPAVTTKELGVTSSSFDLFQRSSSPARPMSSREAKRLSLQNNQSRSFGKGDSLSSGPTVAQKGFKIFHPGDYIYNFELPLDSRLPESIAVDLGTVKYELEALVERSGAFRANLMGTKELTLIRAPSEGSLEQVEPIAISRNWEDQLHYDIVISGKSFPLGSQVPIAFKLTPLAKVQCHRIKVFVTENIQYFTNNKRVHRLEPTRKIQLFEKRADAQSVSSYPGSSMRILSGGGVAFDAREAAAQGNEEVPRDTTNLLGNLENEFSVGPTEMEFNVQLPNCHAMKEKPKSEKLHFDTTFQNIQVNHWIKVSASFCFHKGLQLIFCRLLCGFQNLTKTTQPSEGILRFLSTHHFTFSRVAPHRPTLPCQPTVRQARHLTLPMSLNAAVRAQQ